MVVWEKLQLLNSVQDNIPFLSAQFTQFQVTLSDAFEAGSYPHSIALTWCSLGIHIVHIIRCIFVLLWNSSLTTASHGTTREGAVREERTIDVPCTVTAGCWTVNSLKLHGSGCCYSCFVLFNCSSILQDSQFVPICYRTPWCTTKWNETWLSYHLNATCNTMNITSIFICVQLNPVSS